MQEMIDCLIEEVNRYRGLALLASEEKFKADYLHKAELLERAAKILDKVETGE